MIEDRVWMVTRYVFDERELQYRTDKTWQIEGNDELMKFIKEVIAQSPHTDRWRITYLLEPEKYEEDKIRVEEIESIGNDGEPVIFTGNG